MNPKPRSPLILMALTVLIDFIGFGLILPGLPFWAERFGAGAWEVGLLVTTFAAGQFLLSPALGRLSDRFGRRPVILASLAVGAVGYIASALAGSLSALLAARFVAGLGASNLGSAQAVVADVSAREDRAKNMGTMGAAIGLGFILGPALGGMLTTFGLAAPMWAGALLTLFNFALVLRLLPETRHPLTNPASAERNRVLGILRAPGLIRLVAINLIVTIAFAAMEAMYPLLSQHLLGWGPLQNGWALAYVGTIVVLVQGGGIGPLVRLVGERWLLLGGLFLLAVGLALLPFSAGIALMLVSLAVLGAGLAAASPVLSTLVSLSVPEEAQGESLGLNQGGAAFGRIVGPLAGGALFGSSPYLTFLTAATLVGIAVVMALPRSGALAAPVNQWISTSFTTDESVQRRAGWGRRRR